MTTIKLTQDYCTKKRHETQPISDIEGVIPRDDSVRLLSQVVEEMDLSQLYMAYSALGRNPAVPPDILLKIMLYAYMENNYTTRRIEKSCRRDINYMFLLEGHDPPDHNTIARFRTMRLKDCLENLFFQFVGVLFETGEVELANLFVDGTKIEGSAGRYTFVWKKAVLRYEQKLRRDAAQFVTAFNLEYGTGYENREAKITAATLLPVHHHIALKMAQEGIGTVHGLGHRKHPLQRRKESLEDLIRRKLKYDRYLEILEDRNSFSKTDPDATFMRMKDDHMRNGQLKPAYNLQLGVDSEYIVGVDLSSARTDSAALIPLLDKMGRHFSQRIESVTTDAGYESEENYAGLFERRIAPYIKPATYEMSRKKGYKNRIGLKENMGYIKEYDAFVCTQGRFLPRKGDGRRKSASGYVRNFAYYECPSCTGCPVKENCTKTTTDKRIQVSWAFEKYRKESRENIVSEEGKILRVNRSIQSEGAFGVLKEAYGFTRFLLRGKAKVAIEMLLLSLAYNVNKLHHKIQGNRTHQHLHCLNTG